MQPFATEEAMEIRHRGSDTVARLGEGVNVVITALKCQRSEIRGPSAPHTRPPDLYIAAPEIPVISRRKYVFKEGQRKKHRPIPLLLP